MHIAGIIAVAIAAGGVNARSYSRSTSASLVQPRQLDNSSSYESCVIRSLMFLEWLVWFPAYTYDTTSNATVGDFGIGASDVVSGADFECYAKDINFFPAEGEGWHDCNIPNTQFRFVKEPTVLQMRKNWTCDDAPG
jgi:hypothetical protein